MLQELGAAAMTKRPTSCMLLMPKALKPSADDSAEEAAEYKQSYDDVYVRVQKLRPIF